MTVYHAERDLPDWPEWFESGAATHVDEVPAGCDRAVLYREKNSHKGIAARAGLRKLIASKVNQAFFDEICELKALQYLELNDLTIEVLEPIAGLHDLRTLKLSDVRKVECFDSVLKLPKLERLFIENAKHLTHLEFLADAHHLRSIGIEGSMWTMQKVATLEPLSGLSNLEALFMVSARLIDKDLSYLATCPKLRILQCARFAPKTRFEDLRRLMPDLECQWCECYEISLPDA